MPAKGSKNVYVPLKVKEVGDLVVIIKCGDSFINATTKIIERESVISNSTVINMEGRNYIRKELMLALTSVEGKENTVVSVFKRRPVPLFFEDQWEEEAANEVFERKVEKSDLNHDVRLTFIAGDRVVRRAADSGTAPEKAPLQRRREHPDSRDFSHSQEVASCSHSSHQEGRGCVLLR